MCSMFWEGESAFLPLSPRIFFLNFCVGKTFFILDSTATEPTKSARACDVCYETVFPLLDPPSDSEHPDPSSSITAQSPAAAPSSELLSPYSNTITSMAGFPSWLSMPSLPLSTAGPSDPEALMQLDREPKDREKGGMRHVDDGEGNGEGVKEYDVMREGSSAGTGAEIGPRGRVRMSASRRRRSSYEILEDFGGILGAEGVKGYDLGNGNDDNDNDNDLGNDNDMDKVKGGDVGGEGERGNGDGDTRSRVSVSVTVSEGHAVSARRRENTARRNKRFSLPAVALQTTSVVAQTSGVDGGDGSSGSRSSRVNAGKVKRFSLVLSGRAHAHGQVQGQGKQGFGGSQSDLGMRGDDAKGGDKEGAKSELGRGVAASKLRLLARRGE
jgi:FYVE/RhoGEF/PH domain-containing protein 5/6